MHFPFIHKVLGPNVKVVPIIVGATSQKAAKKYGKVLAPFFDR
jgi:predicted class III extradiol MEMO1 family dioxygenase